MADLNLFQKWLDYCDEHAVEVDADDKPITWGEVRKAADSAVKFLALVNAHPAPHRAGKDAQQIS